MSDRYRYGGSRNRLATLRVSDRSRCGAVRILMLEAILCRGLDKQLFGKDSLHRDLE